MGNGNNAIETIAINFNALNNHKNKKVWENKKVISQIITKLKELKLYKEGTQLHLDYYTSTFNDRRKDKVYLYELREYYGWGYLGIIYLQGDYIFIETKDYFLYPLFKVIDSRTKKEKKPKAIPVKKLDYFIGGGNNGQ